MDSKSQPKPVMERSWMEANLELVKAVNKDKVRDRRFWIGAWFLSWL